MTPLHGEFGVRLDVESVAGLDIGLLRGLIDSHSLVYIPGGASGDDDHLELTRRLGEPEEDHVLLGRQGRVGWFGTVGNVRPDGTVLGNDHENTLFQSGNTMWHSDSSFRAVPTYVSITCAYITPDEGGETLFASQRTAWDRLEPSFRERLEPLVVIHDYVYSRSKVAPVAPSHAASVPPVRQRLVRRNPASGARNLYVGSHAREIEGWPFSAGRALLDDLVAGITADEHVYVHRWQPGDLLIWDNRCLLHRGSGYDADRFRRYMRQTRVRGAGPTLEE